MTLDTDIKKWTAEHDKAVRTAVRVTATLYKDLYQENFPADVMVIGNNWFYIASITYVHGEDVPTPGGGTLAMSKAFAITPKQGITTTEYIPLEAILNEFKDDIGNKLAFLPVVEDRIAEVNKLGTRGRTSDDWYEILTPERTIKVFPLQPDAKRTYLGKSPDGDDVSFTPIDRSGPL